MSPPVLMSAESEEEKEIASYHSEAKKSYVKDRHQDSSEFFVSASTGMSPEEKRALRKERRA